jgi:hypothetical protein
MSSLADLAAAFPEPEWHWVWAGSFENSKLHPGGKGRWSALHEMLTANPHHPRVIDQARDAYAHGGSECFDNHGSSHGLGLTVHECEYLVPGWVYYDAEGGALLADKVTAQYLVSTPGGATVQRDLLGYEDAMSGLAQVDVDALVASGTQEALRKMQDVLGTD